MFVRSGILAASILLSVTSCAAPSLEDAQRHVMPLGGQLTLTLSGHFSDMKSVMSFFGVSGNCYV